MESPQACLFDLDGLLLDTEHLHGQAWRLTASHFGKELSNKSLLLLRGRRRHDCAKQIIQWIEKPIEIEELLLIHKPISTKLISQANAMPGAEELVAWCFKKTIPMALVSSSTSESVAFKSAPHPWLKVIKTRVLGDDPVLKQGKPSPDPFLLAAKKLGVKPASSWAFEDSQSGTAAALAAGCQVWVLNDKRDFCKLEFDKSGKNPIHINHLNVALEELKKILGN